MCNPGNPSSALLGSITHPAMCSAITNTVVPPTLQGNITPGQSNPNSQPGTKGRMCWCAHRDCLTLLRQVQSKGPAQAGPPALPWKMLTNEPTELFNEDISNSLTNFSRNAQIMSVQHWSLLEHSLHAKLLKSLYLEQQIDSR